MGHFGWLIEPPMSFAAARCGTSRTIKRVNLRRLVATRYLRQESDCPEEFGARANLCGYPTWWKTRIFPGCLSQPGKACMPLAVFLYALAPRVWPSFNSSVVH